MVHKRYGLYHLQQTLPNRTDWVWLLNLTIQMGTQTCFLIGGTTKAHLAKHGFALQQDDISVLKMEIGNQLKSEIISQHLEELSLSIGVPGQIIYLHGSDIKTGIELFCQNHRKSKYNYFLPHKMALELKNILEPCHTWQNFLNQCSLTRNQFQQTNLAFLIPPSLRAKSRYMNLYELVDWTQNILSYQARGDFSQINQTMCLDQFVFQQLKTKGYAFVALDLNPLFNHTYSNQSELSKALLQTLGATLTKPIQTLIFQAADLGYRTFLEGFGWINHFQEAFFDYSQLITVVKMVHKQIKQKGLNCKSYQEFEQQVQTEQITSEIALFFAQDITEFLKKEGKLLSNSLITSKSRIGLGSSDIIESIFGKFKLFIKGFSEIGKQALTIPAFLGQLTPENLKQALESIHQQDVDDWITESIGQSTLSKRRIAFSKPKKEQNKGEKKFTKSVQI